MKRKYEPYIVEDLYDNVLLYLDIENIKKMCIINRKFYHLCESPHFWKDKIELDFGFIINPDEDFDYSMLSYESIMASYNEALAIIKNDNVIFLNGDPWFLNMDADMIYSLKIKKEKDYLLTYKIIIDGDEQIVEDHVSKEQLLKLLTLLIYYQHVKFYGNINL